MKILIVECTAEELRANRTVMDSLTEALSGFTRAFAGVEFNPSAFREAMDDDLNEDDLADIQKKIDEAGE